MEAVVLVIGAVVIAVVLLGLLRRKPKEHVPGPENNWRRAPDEREWSPQGDGINGMHD